MGVARSRTVRGRGLERVTQFSVFTANRLGRLHDLVGSFAANGVHVLAMMVLDTTDSAIIRIVVDDPDTGRDLLTQGEFPFTESTLVVVEANSDELARLVTVLLEAEVNVNYLYSFIPHPHGRTILALSMEDDEVAEKALSAHQFRVLQQADLLR